jgi:hypothetical protein
LNCDNFFIDLKLRVKRNLGVEFEEIVNKSFGNVVFNPVVDYKTIKFQTNSLNLKNKRKMRKQKKV